MERSEQICAQHRGIVVIPIVVKPVVVPATGVPEQATHALVAVRVAIIYKAPSVPLPIEYFTEYFQGCILSGI